MLLAVDVGNTNVVFAVCEGREIRARWRIATDPRRTADQYAVWLIQLMAIENIERTSIDQIIVSSVVPRALHNLDVLAKKYFGLDPSSPGRGPTGGASRPMSMSRARWGQTARSTSSLRTRRILAT